MRPPPSHYPLPASTSKLSLVSFKFLNSCFSKFHIKLVEKFWKNLQHFFIFQNLSENFRKKLVSCSNFGVNKGRQSTEHFLFFVFWLKSQNIKHVRGGVGEKGSVENALEVVSEEFYIHI